MGKPPAAPPRVDFYILGEGRGDRESFACRLAETAFRRDLRVFVLTCDDAQARRMDERLWTFRDVSFVPHARLGDAAAPPAPVLIGTRREAPGPDVLINLTDQVPPDHAGLARIAEIIGADAADREAGRSRFRRYRELGMEPAAHHID